jgi:predicted  nucleic acid-binding Zn-ribbon protein
MAKSLDELKAELAESRRKLQEQTEQAAILAEESRLIEAHIRKLMKQMEKQERPKSPGK